LCLYTVNEYGKPELSFPPDEAKDASPNNKNGELHYDQRGAVL